MKRCPDCGETKPLDAFYKNRASKDGVQGYCKPCWDVRTKRYDSTKADRRRASGLDAQRRYNIRRLGISQEEYDALWLRAGGKCEGCGREERAVHHRTGTPFRVALDHDHRTGKVRGFLCLGCNRAVGCVNDDPSTLRRLADYLDEAASG